MEWYKPHTLQVVLDLMKLQSNYYGQLFSSYFPPYYAEFNQCWLISILISSLIPLGTFSARSNHVTAFLGECKSIIYILTYEYITISSHLGVGCLAPMESPRHAPGLYVHRGCTFLKPDPCKCRYILGPFLPTELMQVFFRTSFSTNGATGVCQAYFPSSWTCRLAKRWSLLWSCAARGTTTTITTGAHDSWIYSRHLWKWNHY